jgi:hypothetical protein
MQNPNRWLDLPDDVAILIGRILYYAGWLDDTLGELVVHGNPDATHCAESTPGWAASGEGLVDAVRRIKGLRLETVDNLAHNLALLNGVRNQLVHGVWLWKDDRVLLLKRSLGKRGERTVDYGEMTYAEIKELVEAYKRLNVQAEAILEYLKATNPASTAMEAAFVCPKDGGELKVILREEVMLNQCTSCTWEAEAAPGTLGATSADSRMGVVGRPGAVSRRSLMPASGTSTGAFDHGTRLSAVRPKRLRRCERAYLQFAPLSVTFCSPTRVDFDRGEKLSQSRRRR